MINGLICGRLFGRPQERTSRDGKHEFVTAKIRCATDGGETQFVDAVAFASDAKAALLALDNGDSVALTGSLSFAVWQPSQGEPRPQVKLNVHGVLSPYQARHRQSAVHSAAFRTPDTPASDNGTREASQRAGSEAFHDDTF